MNLVSIIINGEYLVWPSLEELVRKFSFLSNIEGYQCLSFYKKLVESGEIKDQTLRASVELQPEASLPQNNVDTTIAPTETLSPVEALTAQQNAEKHQIPASTGIVYPVQVSIKALDISSIEICVFCGSSGDPANLLFCAECGDCFHSFCLSPPVNLPEEKKSTWRYWGILCCY
jgi:hypothetical protein